MRAASGRAVAALRPIALTMRRIDMPLPSLPVFQGGLLRLDAHSTLDPVALLSGNGACGASRSVTSSGHPTGSGPQSRLQRPSHGLRVTCDHGQIGARGLVRFALALLPVAKGA